MLEYRGVIRDELCCHELNEARGEVLRFIKLFNSTDRQVERWNISLMIAIADLNNPKSQKRNDPMRGYQCFVEFVGDADSNRSKMQDRTVRKLQIGSLFTNS